MAKATFYKSQIIGIHTTVGQIKKCIDDEVETYGGNTKQIDRIKKSVGLHTRHLADDSTTALDLCSEAAEKLLDGLNFDRKLLCGIIFVTQTPDHFQPCNAAILHGRLALETRTLAFDINLGCSGYIYGLFVAQSLIETCACKHILLLAGDTLSKTVNKKDRAVAPIFGDAGTATLLSAANSTPSFFTLNTDGSGSNSIIIPAGGFRTPSSTATAQEVTDEDGNTRSLQNIKMNGMEVFNFSILREPQSIKELFEYSKLCDEQIDLFFFHQANKYIIQNIMRRLKIPIEKVPLDTISKYGNQSSASIPCTICDELAGNSVKKSVLLSGFGVGLSWASCIMDLSEIRTNVNVYEGIYNYEPI